MDLPFSMSDSWALAPNPRRQSENPPVPGVSCGLAELVGKDSVVVLWAVSAGIWLKARAWALGDGKVGNHRVEHTQHSGSCPRVSGKKKESLTILCRSRDSLSAPL